MIARTIALDIIGLERAREIKTSMFGIEKDKFSRTDVKSFGMEVNKEAVRVLHQNGRTNKEISELLGIAENTVRYLGGECA